MDGSRFDAWTRRRFGGAVVGALVMAVMDAPIQRRFEALADAGDEDGIADEVERFWLLDIVGHDSGFPQLAGPHLTQRQAACPRSRQKSMGSGGSAPDERFGPRHPAT